MSEAQCILDYFESRLRKRQHTNGLGTGGLGSGKSYGQGRIGELWYKRKFNEDFPISHIVEQLDHAVGLVKDFSRPGELIIIEEVSVLASSRDSLTRMNKLWNKFLDTCRIKQVILLMNCPHINFIDKHILSLTNLWIEFLGVNYKKGYSIAKPLWLQTSQYRQLPYKHKFVSEDGFPIDFIKLNKPSKSFCEAYDMIKDASVNELYEDISRRMALHRQYELKEMGKKLLSKKEQEAWDLSLEGYSMEDAAVKMGLKHARTYWAYLNRAKDKIKFNELKDKSFEKSSKFTKKL